MNYVNKNVYFFMGCHGCSLAALFMITTMQVHNFDGLRVSSALKHVFDIIIIYS